MGSAARARLAGILIPVTAVVYAGAWPTASHGQSVHTEGHRQTKSVAHVLIEPAAPKSFNETVAGFEYRQGGLLPVYLNRKEAQVFIALRPNGAEGDLGQFLYQLYLRSGLGSTPVGLDRSDPADTQFIAFCRAGKRVFAELQNTGFRAEHGSASEAAAVHESFASSTIWSTSIVAEAPDGAVLIDLSDFLTRDAFGVVDALTQAKQGKFKLDVSLSYPDVSATEVLPENLEFEAHQTFTSDAGSSNRRRQRRWLVRPHGLVIGLIPIVGSAT